MKPSSVSTLSVSVGSIIRAPGDHQREIDRRRVEAVVEQALGDVERLHPVRSLDLVGEHDLVQRGRSRRQSSRGRRSRARGSWPRAPRHSVDSREAVAAAGTHVRARADEDAEVAVERPHLADRMRPVVLPRQCAVPLDDARARQERLEVVSHRDRPGAGAAAAVRRRERLVQVELQHVDAHVARLGHADQRVHVGAVHVDETAGCVHGRRDRARCPPRRGRACSGWSPSSAATSSSSARSRRRAISSPRSSHGTATAVVAAQRRARRVGAVGARRDQHLLARTAARLVPGADHLHAGELALRAGGGLQRHGVEAADLARAMLEIASKRSAPCTSSLRRVRMRFPRSPASPRPVVGHRVVLHRARAERIEVRRCREVELRQSRDSGAAPPARRPRESLEIVTQTGSDRAASAPAGTSTTATARARLLEDERLAALARIVGDHRPPPTTRRCCAVSLPLATAEINASTSARRVALGHRDQELAAPAGIRAGQRRRCARPAPRPAPRTRRTSPRRAGSSIMNSLKNGAEKTRGAAASAASRSAASFARACVLRRKRAQTAAAGQAEEDGDRERGEPLVRADVRRRLLAADVLLASRQCQHVSPRRPASSTVSPDQTARHLPQVRRTRREQARRRGRRTKPAGRGSGLRPPRCRRRTRQASAAARARAPRWSTLIDERAARQRPHARSPQGRRSRRRSSGSRAHTAATSIVRARSSAREVGAAVGGERHVLDDPATVAARGRFATTSRYSGCNAGRHQQRDCACGWIRSAISTASASADAPS